MSADEAKVRSALTFLNKGYVIFGDKRDELLTSVFRLALKAQRDDRDELATLHARSRRLTEDSERLRSTVDQERWQRTQLEQKVTEAQRRLGKLESMLETR